MKTNIEGLFCHTCFYFNNTNFVIYKDIILLMWLLAPIRVLIIMVNMVTRHDNHDY